MVENLLNEIWVAVKGYEGLYEISNFGRLKSLKRFNRLYRGDGYWRKEKILSPIEGKRGYGAYSLHKDNVMKICKIHRLVAEAFIPNPENKMTINHINGIKMDNRVENLEWATLSEQQLHSYKELGKKSWTTGLAPEFLPCSKIVKCDTLGIVFPSATEAAKILGGTKTDISNYITGKRTNRYGLTFRYI